MDAARRNTRVDTNGCDFVVDRLKSLSGDAFRLVVEAAPSGMIMVDRSGMIVLINAEVERLFGYSRDQLIGQTIEKLVPLRFRGHHPDHREGFLLDPQVRAMGAGRDLFGLKMDGTEIPVEIGLNPITTDEGQFVLASVVDITERRRAEEQLLKAKDELERRVQERTSELEERASELVELNRQLADASQHADAASRLKSEFLANMSHEIRTPMNAIIGLCNVLLRTGLHPRQYEYAGNIKDSANALLTVINDILDFSKIEAGRLDLEIVDFDLVKIVEGTCELLATSARSKHLSLMAYIDPKLPQQLRGDPERLRQVLINLTSNAIKFSERGAIVVRADLQSIESTTAFVRFSVIDQGVGLTTPEQDRLFQPFVQADGSISRRFGGTGLGLSISKRIVELMRGSIGVDSSKGSGSTFWFTVPFESRSASPILSSRSDLADTRVLVVDDEPHARTILQDYLRSWGMRDGMAVSAKEALRALRQAYVDGEPYNIAIIDFVMPNTNGMDLSKEILSDRAISQTNLILLTAFDGPGLGIQAVDLGFKAYLTKPVRQSQMLECIVNVLSGGHAIDRSATDAKLAIRESKAMREEVILIAEDYAINQQVAQLYLDELGFASYVVANGAAAVEAVATNKYALVLMDCQMPEMDGYAATAAIRDAEKASGGHTPIVAMTAHAMGGDRERCLAAGMDDYLSKPVEPEELRKVLGRWLPEPNSPIVSVVGEKPADLELARSRFGVKEADELCRMFIDKAALEVESLKRSCLGKDYQAVLETAHGFAGICATIFAHQMRVTCAEIEAGVVDLNWDLVQGLVLRMEKEFNFAKEHLRCQL